MFALHENDQWEGENKTSNINLLRVSHILCEADLSTYRETTQSETNENIM